MSTPVHVHYETFGDPSDPTLLLVNGLGSQCINYRESWCAKWAALGLRVVRYDNRDCGLSPQFADTAPDLEAVITAKKAGQVPDTPYTIADMAADGIWVLDQLGVDKAHVLGLSMGGMIVQQMSIDHPHRLLSVTSVMSTTGDPDVGQSSPEAGRLLRSRSADTREGYIAQSIEGLRVWGSPEYFNESRIADEAGAAYDRSFTPDGYARQLMAIMAADSRTEALGEVRLPALVMHGDQDRLVDISGGRRTAEALPNSVFVEVAGMGHDYPPEAEDHWIEVWKTNILDRA